MPTLRGGCQHTILPKFPKNSMKLKEFGRGGCVQILLRRSATGVQVNESEIFSSMGRVMGFFVTRLTIDVASAEIYFLQFCQNPVDLFIS